MSRAVWDPRHNPQKTVGSCRRAIGHAWPNRIHTLTETAHRR